MAIPVIMPRHDESDDYQYRISNWIKRKGDRVESGEALFSYMWEETKYTETAPGSGLLLEILYPENTAVTALTFVAIIGKSGENVADFVDKDELLDAQIERKTTEGDHHHSEKGKQKQENVVLITPRAKKLAEDHDLNYELIEGSGKNGKITTKDIEFLITDKGYETDNNRNLFIESKNLTANRTAEQVNFYSTIYAAIPVQNIHNLNDEIVKETKYKTKNRISVGLIIFCILRTLQMNLKFNSLIATDNVKSYMKVNLLYAVDTKNNTEYRLLPDAGQLTFNDLLQELENISVLKHEKTSSFAFVPHVYLALTYNSNVIQRKTAIDFLENIKQEVIEIKLKTIK